jgi:hypothetical protein
MLCPCCGRPAGDLRRGCACGAQAVGEPDTTPIAPVRRMGPAMFAFGCSALALGCFVTKLLLPVLALGLFLSFRACRQIRADRVQFGGARLAVGGAVVSAAVAVTLGVSGSVKAVRWYEGLAEGERAATRARMMELAIAFHEYKRVHGAFPGQLDELRAEGLLSGPTVDFWGKALSYRPTGQIAAVEVTGRRATTVVASGPALTQYQLTSAGADGILGTKDDIVLSDNVFAPKR